MTFTLLVKLLLKLHLSSIKRIKTYSTNELVENKFEDKN